MAEHGRLRAIVTYSKTGLARYLGHREVLRTLDRAVRRAGLRVQYSQGFSPRAQLSFPPPLPVGAEGSAELCSIELAAQIDAREVYDALAPELVALPISNVRVQRRVSRSAWVGLVTASYSIAPEWADLVPEQRLQGAVATLLAAKTLTVRRETKSRVRAVDIRPDIHSLQVRTGNVLEACLGITEQALVKPDEVVTVLGSALEVEGSWRRLVRTGLHFAPHEGEPTGPPTRGG